MIYGIIKKHNGYIILDSAPVKGTELRIYLSLSKEVSEEEYSQPVQPSFAGTETLLLTEENPETKKFTVTVLTDLGDNIIAATDGADALINFVENKSKVDLVLLDVVMPKMNGKEVHGKIMKIPPEVKVILLSGFSKN